MRSNVLTNEERLEIKPSRVISWSLESIHFREATSRHAQAAAELVSGHRGFGIPSQKITALWSTSSDPMSSISLGIRVNPQGFFQTR